MWDQLVAKAKNATFLFYRDFIEYHKDRFEDHSVLVFKNQDLFGVLPGNKNQNTLYSHQGLTYGGLIVAENSKFPDVLGGFSAILKYLKEHEIDTLNLKLLPKIYVTAPSDELDYLLFKLRAKLVRRDILSVIDNSNLIKPVSNNRKRGFKRALEHGLVIKEEQNLKPFWDQILIPNLDRIHNTKPVHTPAEIQYLKEKFPRNIRQFNVYHNDVLVAGATIFETDQVAHAQYIAADQNRQQLGSLDLLFTELLTTTFKTKRYFDFGISNENQGAQINEGLLHWKESFGARSISQSFYEIETGNIKSLNDIMI